MTSTISLTNTFPTIENEPRQKDVLSDLKVKQCVDLDLVSDEFYECYGQTLGSRFKWMPDVNIEMKSFPVDQDAVLTSSAPADTTFTKSGLLTFPSAKLLLSGYYRHVLEIQKVTSLRSVGVYVQCDIGTWFQNATLATFGSETARVRLFAAGANRLTGTPVASRKFIPFTKVEFSRTELETAGDGCFIDVTLEAVGAGSRSTWQLNGDSMVRFVIDFKNKTEDALYAALVAGVAVVGSEIIIPLIERLINQQIDVDIGIRNIINIIAQMGISITDIIAVIAAGFWIRYSNDSSFSIEDIMTTDWIRMLFGMVQQIVTSNMGPLAIGIIGTAASSALSNAVVAKILGLASRGVAAYLLAVYVIAYIPTIELKAWI